jgi:hypothetical protein
MFCLNATLVAASDGHKVHDCIYRGILCMALKIKLLDKLNQKLCQLQKKKLGSPLGAWFQ